MKPLLFAAVVLLLATGYDTKDPVPAATPQAAAKHVAAKKSAIEGVPVPATAKLQPGKKPLREDLRMETYRVVDMSFDELNAWYEQHMPKGKPWNGWRWEEPIPGRMYINRIYCRQKRDGISVTIFRAEGGNPPGINIAQDGSGSGC